MDAAVCNLTFNILAISYVYFVEKKKINKKKSFLLPMYRQIMMKLVLGGSWVGTTFKITSHVINKIIPYAVA